VNIGYHRLGGNFELFRPDTLASITDVERIPRVRSMVEQGHNLIILSPMDSFDRKIYKSRGNSLIRFPKFFYKLQCPLEDISKIDQLDEYIDQLDVLFIECGPTNTTYGDVFGMTYWQLLSYILKRYEGTVVYFQNDAVLTFPFGELLSTTPIEGRSPLNIRYIVQTSNIFENKNWIVLHHALDEEYWINNAYTRNGKSYAEILDHFSDVVKFRYVSHPYDGYALDEKYNPSLYWLPNSKNTKYDIVWIGSRYSSGSGNSGKREDRYVYLERFLHTDLYKVVVIGRQWEDFVKKHPNIFLGVIGDIRKTAMLYQMALSTIILDSEVTVKSGYFSFRLYESIFFGTLPMIDSRYELLNNIIGIEDIVVESQTDVKKALEWWRGLSEDEKTEFRMELLSKFPKYSDILWEDVMRW